ncbi:MAG: hypothetical protein WB809_04530 [Thermoplasmata archaeon]
MSRSADAPEPPPPSDNFIRSIPLFVVAGVFFAIGVLAFLLDPHYGPGFFTLWALLIALGFISAIGGVASWLLVAEPSSSPPTARAVRKPAPDPPGPSKSSGVPPRARNDFGRPTPDVREVRDAPVYRPHPSDFGDSVSAAPVWDEEGAREEPPPPIGDPASFVSVEEALKDLDGIEQALVPRGRPPSRGESTS